MLEWYVKRGFTRDHDTDISVDGTTYTVSDGGSSSPFQYTFDQSLGEGSDDNQYICHFFFPGTSVGNTVTFQYLNSPTGSTTTWQQNSQVASALAGVTVTVGSQQSGATATATVTRTVTAEGSTFLTTISNPSTTFVSSGTGSALAATTSPPQTDTSTQSSGLSAGAAAGIAIAALLALLGVLALAFLIWRRVKKDRREQHGPIATPTPAYGTEVKPPPMQQQGYYPPQGSGAAPPDNQPRRTIHEVEG